MMPILIDKCGQSPDYRCSGFAGHSGQNRAHVIRIPLQSNSRHVRSKVLSQIVQPQLTWSMSGERVIAHSSKWARTFSLVSPFCSGPPHIVPIREFSANSFFISHTDRVSDKNDLMHVCSFYFSTLSILGIIRPNHYRKSFFILFLFTILIRLSPPVPPGINS
jgi:hypothetical protein